MDEKSLKTSVWQRVIIIAVAVLLLGSTILTYMFIVMSGNSADEAKQAQQNNIAELQSKYTAKGNELKDLSKPLSDKYFKTMKQYKESQVKSYNAATVNNEILKTIDLKTGDGKELTEGDTDYMAYYIGWCADGSIFDSSFEYAKDEEASTEENIQYTDEVIGLNAPLIASSGLIEGWTQGVVGMKLGGVRQLAISSDLAYGETTEGRHICGQSNSPLKFVVLALPTDEAIKKTSEELNELYLEYYSALLGGSY